MNLKTILLTILLLCLYGVANAQYRALTMSTTNGAGITKSTTFHSASVNFHWDFNDQWFLSSWSGVSYDTVIPSQRWVASDVAINKYLPKNFSIGSGIQYRYAQEEGTSDFYWTIKISKTIRFK